MLNMSEISLEQQYEQKVILFLNNIIKYLNLPRTEVSEALGIQGSDLNHILSGKKPLEVEKFARFSRYIGFSLSRFEDGEVDFRALREHWLGNAKHIPNAYTVGARSRNTMLINVFNYVKKVYEQTLAEGLLRHLQIDESILLYPDEKSNFHLFRDAISFLKMQGLNDWDVYKIGLNTIQTNNGTHFAKKMKSFKTPKSMYENYLGCLIEDVERNNRYQIVKITDKICEVESLEREEMLDIFKVSHIGHRERCIYRVGGLAGATMYLGLPQAQVEEVSCVHSGDPVCKFRINFENPNFFCEGVNVH